MAVAIQPFNPLIFNIEIYHQSLYYTVMSSTVKGYDIQFTFKQWIDFQ
jgi:hypothetical protein